MLGPTPLRRMLLAALVVAAAAAFAAADGQQLKSASGLADGVTAFEVTPGNSVMQLSGGAVLGSTPDQVLYGGGNVVYQVQFTSDHSSATLQKTFSFSQGTSYYQMIGGRALSPTLLNGSAWFQTRSGGLTGGLVAFNPESPDSLPAEVDTITNARMNYAFLPEGTTVPYAIMNGALFQRSGYQVLTMLTQLPPTFMYNAKKWGNLQSTSWTYNMGYVYMFGVSHKPGQATSDAPWYTVVRVAITSPYQNQTMYLRQLVAFSEPTVNIPATMFFDDENMYVTYVPTVNTAVDDDSQPSNDDPDMQQTINTIQILSYPLSTAFEPGTVATVFPTVDCESFYPQPSLTMVDRQNQKAYLICGISQLTRITLTGSDRGRTETMCDDPYSPGGKPAQYYLPANVPASMKIPMSFTNYGDVDLGSVTNYVGWIDLNAVDWHEGFCPFAWWNIWWIWLIIAVVLLCVAGGVALCCRCRRKRMARGLSMRAPLAAGAGAPGVVQASAGGYASLDDGKKKVDEPGAV